MNFREMILKSGKKIILGRSAESNDELLKKFRGKRNFILHTESPGSPFCVIESLKPSKSDIQLSAAAVARYSQNWRDNKKDVRVHIFTGMDIEKKNGMIIGTWGVKAKPKTISVKREDIEKFNKGK